MKLTNNNEAAISLRVDGAEPQILPPGESIEFTGTILFFGKVRADQLTFSSSRGAELTFQYVGYDVEKGGVVVHCREYAK